ncbi:hypothetical protein DN524_33435, partial [Burkholderia multivorans]
LHRPTASPLTVPVNHGDRVQMYNVIRSQELRAHGVHSRVVKSAVDCCLLRLTRGMYSVIRRCENPQHARIAELITDEDWLRRV